MGKTGPMTLTGMAREECGATDRGMGPKRSDTAPESLICLTYLSSVIHRHILEQVTCARKGNQT